MITDWIQRYSSENIAQDALDIFLSDLRHTVRTSGVCKDGDEWIAMVGYETTPD